MPPRRIRRIPASLATLQRGPLPRGTDVRYCHGHCWTEETSDRFDDDHLVPDDRGSCKGPPPDCRRIVIRLRNGIKGRSGRRATSTGESAWLTYTRIGP